MKLPITRIVLYKHGIGYFEREGSVSGDDTLSLTFKQREVSDVLKSLTVLDLDGGTITSVSYDSTKPIEQLLADVALNIPDSGSLVSLLPQIKGARISLHTGVSEPVEGALLGIDTAERSGTDGVLKVVLVSVLTDQGSVQSFDLHSLAHLQILDEALRNDLEFYLRTQLSATRKDSRTFIFFAQGEDDRRIRMSYILEAPVWKATYRILLNEDDKPPLIQGWAVVDNTSDEDWDDVQLSLIAGLPVSFVHDLYTPRYIRRPEVRVKDTTGVLPPEVEEGIRQDEMSDELKKSIAIKRLGKEIEEKGTLFGPSFASKPSSTFDAAAKMSETIERSTPSQTRERVIGDLLEYEIKHPVSIGRNHSALVPIVLRDFEGKPVLLHNSTNRRENPMSAVLFKNTTGLTLEGGPVTVLQSGSYVGEAMLDTMKPNDERIIPYAVELSVSVLDNVDSYSDDVYHVIIKDGRLKASHRSVQQTTYTFKNKADKNYQVYLEHPRAGEQWHLFDTPQSVEVTENYWRFKFELQAKKTQAFVVKQRSTRGVVYHLSDEYGNQLAHWINQTYLDDSVKQVLEQAMEHRKHGSRLGEQIQQLEQERKNIFQSQQRIRDNLQSLGDRDGEKELRGRYVRSLQTHEDRLEEIDREIQQKNGERDECKQRIKELLHNLDFDGPVNGKG